MRKKKTKEKFEILDPLAPYIPKEKNIDEKQPS